LSARWAGGRAPRNGGDVNGARRDADGARSGSISAYVNGASFDVNGAAIARTARSK
jgi:hypothetical protein